MHDNLYNRRLMHGFWDNIFECQGNLPDAREGATISLLNEKIYVFGGFSRILFDDLKVLDLVSGIWKQILPTED